MLCHLKHQNWNADMIYFDNETIVLTPSYETQRLFSKYSGDRLLASGVTMEGVDNSVTKRVAATIVEDSASGKRYLKVVNVLPVPLTLTVKAPALKANCPTEGFSGKPSQERVKVATTVKGTINGGNLQLQIPPYSLEVVEL